MALTDGDVVLPGRGFLFYNPTAGATPPFTAATVGAADLEADTLGTGWANFGHTSEDNAVSMSRDVEEGQVKNTWQRRGLRKTRPKVTWGFNIPALQMSNHVFDMYFGAGDKSEEDVYHVVDDAPAIEGAFMLVLVDGDVRVPIYVPKVTYEGDDAPEFGTEDFTEFNIKATVLGHAGAKGLMSIYKAGLGTPA